MSSLLLLSSFICLFICLFIYLFICLFIYLFIIAVIKHICLFNNLLNIFSFMYVVLRQNVHVAHWWGLISMFKPIIVMIMMMIKMTMIVAVVIIIDKMLFIYRVCAC